MLSGRIKKFFLKSGGVPHTIWFDNLSAAVAHIERDGDRLLTDSFLKFKCHYGFKSVFCNPASGNKKGNVENKCGYTRCNFCVPIPIFESFEKLEAELDERTKLDMDRAHYEKETKIRELWLEEVKLLRKLSDNAYEVYRLESILVNNYGEVKGYIKKPRSVTHSQFAKMLPKELRDYISIENLESRRERISACINWLRVYIIYEISECLERFKDNSTISMITAMLHVMNSYSYINELNESYTPKEIKESETSLDKYALLSKAGV